MPGRRWDYVAFNDNKVHVITAQHWYSMLGAHVEESRIAGEDGAEIDFTTPRGATCKLILRSRQSVVDLVAALNKAIDA